MKIAQQGLHIVALSRYFMTNAIIKYCNEIDIDVEAVANLINQSLKDKIQNEAEEQYYMRPRGKLPL